MADSGVTHAINLSFESIKLPPFQDILILARNSHQGKIGLSRSFELLVPNGFDVVEVNEGNVTDAERDALRDAANETPGVVDDENLEAAELDQTDEDGTPLNEETDRSGSDLDVPGSEEDDANEAIGEEDEENNSYSLGGESEDDSVQKQ